MKKNYISPLTTLFTIEAQRHLMEGSVQETLKTEEVSDGDDFVQAVRQSSIWDDEEE